MKKKVHPRKKTANNTKSPSLEQKEWKKLPWGRRKKNWKGTKSIQHIHWMNNRPKRGIRKRQIRRKFYKKRKIK